MAGLLKIFYAPDEVFDQVRDRGTWVPAFLASVLIMALTYGAIVALIGPEQLTRKQIESNARMAQQLGPEGIEKAAQAAGTPGRKAVGYVFALVGSAAVLLVVAGFMAGGIAITGSRLSFGRALGATSYAWFPFAVLGCVLTVLIISLSPDRNDLDIRNLVASNVGAFLDKETTNKAVYSFAGSLDLIAFAQIAFLSYGLSKVAAVSFVRALIIVLVGWLIFVGAKSALALVF